MRSLLRTTVSFYNYKKKSVYACAIDASKAFDKINRILMAHKLIGKTHPLVWRALVYYYESSIAYVLNKNETSSLFKTTIGVKQGGPLSPRLFAIYVEDLISELEASEYGTEIGQIRTGVLMFADDLIVLCDSKEKLQKMLKIVEKYCLKNEIKINAKKTQYIRFGNFDCQSESQSITLDGLKIKRVEKIEYLGVWIDSKLKAHTQIEEKKESITNAFNALRRVGITDKEAKVRLKTFLFKVYCRPILYYGVENLTLQKKDVKSIQTVEATLIKYSHGLSKTVRTTNLLNAVDIEQACQKILVIKLKFFKRLLFSEITNKIIGTIVKAYERSKDNSLIKNSLIKDVLECVGEPVLIDSRNYVLNIKNKLKQIRENDKNEREKVQGIYDTIKFCLENRTEKRDKILKTLVQSYIRVQASTRSNTHNGNV